MVDDAVFPTGIRMGYDIRWGVVADWNSDGQDDQLLGAHLDDSGDGVLLTYDAPSLTPTCTPPEPTPEKAAGPPGSLVQVQE